ncbi:hypothetical protein FV242_21520 [Methylobacterium sp. WL64]|uniref:hypothetical protein n=1 Tax=Methylobacterium sp. WL64 TaxID=2603894 RepID=UPI0011CAD676|nr:hypothetical protein [Methylobacterium sp. WL64]TXN00575.1 hypothetical protein FV242_21520 [Methylobacterium sp. WL64]
MANFDPDLVNLIGGESVIWPAEGQPEYADHWRLMHKAVRHVREVVTGAEPKLQTVEGNRDLSEVGRTRQLSDIGLETIRRVDECPALDVARQGVAARLAKLDAEMQDHAKPPEEPAAIAQAGEIRAALRAMAPAERMRFIHANITRAGFAGAVSGDAAYLAGLSETEVGEIRNAIAERFYAPQAAEKAKLTRALRELDVAVLRAHNLVAGRSRVGKNVHGEWAVSQAAPGGPAPHGRAA